MPQSKNPKGSLHIYTPTWKVGRLLRGAGSCLQKREVELLIGSQCYISQQSFPETNNLGFSGDPVVKNPLCNTEGTSSIPGLGRSHKSQGNQARARQLLSLCSLEPVCHYKGKPSCCSVDPGRQKKKKKEPEDQEEDLERK